MFRQYADIAFPTPVRRLFTYGIPAGMAVGAGMRVWVPLRNEKAIGMVVRIHSEKPAFKVRPLIRVLDRKPVMSEFILELTDWIHKFYYCSRGEAIQSALPVGLNFVSEKRLRVNRPETGLDREDREMISDIENEGLSFRDARKRWKSGKHLKRLNHLIKTGVLEIWEQPVQKTGYKTVKHWDWCEGVDRQSVENVCTRSAGTKWGDALNVLADLPLPAAHRSLVGHEKISDYSLRRIAREGLIISRDLPVTESTVPGPFRPEGIKQLSEEQEVAFCAIRDALNLNSYQSFLLYGVTGSGKTEVYIHALKHTLSRGRGGMILVPEIALTPQTVRRFYQVFGNKIAVIHSRLNDRERFEAWTGLLRGEKQIVIGPRSAVFAPVQNLGLIVVDEEHDSSYKQFDPSPRYHARNVAIMRAHKEKAVVVMGSATPSMNSIQGVYDRKHTLLQLLSRPEGAMPEVRILDMKQYHSAMRGPLTVSLYEAIRQALDRKEQIILLYNRRGFASYLQCEECGHIPQSPDCSVSLTYHKKKNMLLCHYSGYARKADTRCEECGSEKIVSKGSGTQQVEDEIHKLFPEAELLRMDRDTTSGKYAHRRIYEKFLDGGADILIGTQLVSKGLDFPNVTVVGVLSAETELAFPSFRSGERMYQLLSQVAGRAGRGAKAGRVYVQTWKPDHRAVQYAKDHDYWTFTAEELAERKHHAYPPYSRMIIFHFKGKSDSATHEVAESFSEAMKAETSESAVLGPAPGVIEWMHGLCLWESHIKINPGRNARAVEDLVDRIFNRYNRTKPKGAGSVRITVDVDAVG